MFYHISKIFFVTLFKISNRFKVVGKENIPKTGPAIIVANHISYWDPLITGAGLPRRIKFIAKEELFRIPLIGYIITAWGAISIKRGHNDREAINKSLKILGQGHILGIFIEGTRNINNPEQMLKPQPGVAMLAVKSGAPVIPTAIINSQKILRSFRRVKVVFGTPLKFTEEPELDKKELYEKIGNQIVQKILELRRA